MGASNRQLQGSQMPMVTTGGQLTIPDITIHPGSQINKSTTKNGKVKENKVAPATGSAPQIQVGIMSL